MTEVEELMQEFRIKAASMDKFVPSNAHIPDLEVEEDIAETEHEIAQMEREERGFRLIGDRMSVFRADARRDGIKQRKEFVAKLKVLLEKRS